MCPADIDVTEVQRPEENGPFDLVGDVHGCFDELVELLLQLGYEVDANEANPQAVPPAGRRFVFLGDLADRGPKCPAVLRLAMNMVRAGHAFCVMGNHDNKLMRKLKGNDVEVAWGLQETLDQLAGEDPALSEELFEFLRELPLHLVLDGGQLVVAHAGLREDLHGVQSSSAKAFSLYGATTGEKDELGFPVRLDWAAEYGGQSAVVYGHTPVPEATWRNNTINIDTGCVYGGQLTGLRYPEREVVQIQAKRVYYTHQSDLDGSREVAAKRAKGE
jgi:protein phosphatase